jgi:uncharacterized protein YgiM (DUF1202 family)
MTKMLSFRLSAFWGGLLLLSTACAPILVTSTTSPVSTPVATNESIVEEPEDAAIATVTTRSLRVRRAPLETADVIAGLSEGEQYPVLGISSDGLWVQLAIDSAVGGTGWVSASFVSIEGPITDAVTTAVPASVTPVSPTVSLAPSEGVTVTIEVAPPPGFAQIVTDGTRLRVRGEPNTESEIVGYVYNGEIYPVIQTSDDGTWVQIGPSRDNVTDNPDGGWVAAEFVVIGE